MDKQDKGEASKNLSFYIENKVKQSEQNINSALYPKPLGDDANSYQLAQNNKTNTMTDANNNQNKPAVTFNDVLQKSSLNNISNTTIPVKLYNVGKTVNDIYNLYKNDGFYAIGKKYGTPSVQQASHLAEELAPEKISDTNKHSAVSCVGASGGALSALETLGGGVAKEVKDIYEKSTDPNLRKQYGGIGGILSDSFKDLKNDFQATWTGFCAENPQVCKKYLPPYLHNKIK